MKLICGDALQELKKMDPESVHCCVTSPPYWSLRDYGTATWDGGNVQCVHVVGKPGRGQHSPYHKAIVGDIRPGVDASTCTRCGARRVDSQLGLERTPEEYIATMVKVFHEVKRVLRKDGTLWLNLGDSYYNNFGGESKTMTTGQKKAVTARGRGNKPPHPTLKIKDLVGIPWSVAFGLRADGWYLRSDVIWNKENSMPESVLDRPTKSHEYIFLMSRSQTYFYDADSIRESSTSEGMSWAERKAMGEPSRHGLDGAAKSGAGNFLTNSGGRNKRSVWTVNTQPFPEAHFAVFPSKLIKPCILAGCPKGGVVLDPFMGSGTTGFVSLNADRNFIGIDLSREYVEMARARIKRETAQQRMNFK